MWSIFHFFFHGHKVAKCQVYRCHFHSTSLRINYRVFVPVCFPKNEEKGENWRPRKSIFRDFERNSGHEQLMLRNSSTFEPCLLLCSKFSQKFITGFSFNKSKQNLHIKISWNQNLYFMKNVSE